MKISIPDCFMIAFAAGMIFGPVYEALRIVRLILRMKPVIFVCDVIFFALSALCVVKLSEYLGNYVRIYTVLGFGAGVFAYITTVGRIFNALESAASVAWRKTLGRLLSKLAHKTRKAFVNIAHKTKGGFVRAAKYLREQQKKLSKPLNLKAKKVYNNKRLEKNGDNISGEGENSHVIKASVRRSS